MPQMSSHERSSDLSMDDSLGSATNLRQTRDSLDKARHDLLQQHFQQQQQQQQNGSAWRRPGSPFVKAPKIIRNHGDRSLYVKLSDLPDDLRQQIRLLHADDDDDGSGDGDKQSLQKQKHHPLEEPMCLSAQPTLEEIQMCFAQIDLAMLMEHPPLSPQVLNIRPRSVSPAKAFLHRRHHQHSDSAADEIVYEEWSRRRRNEASGGGHGSESRMKEMMSEMTMAGTGTSCCRPGTSTTNLQQTAAAATKTKKKTKKKTTAALQSGMGEYEDYGSYEYDYEEGGRSDSKNNMNMSNLSVDFVVDEGGDPENNMADGGGRLSSLRSDREAGKKAAKSMQALAAAAAAASAAAAATAAASAAASGSGGRTRQIPTWTTDGTSSRLRYDATWDGNGHVDVLDPCHPDEDA